MKYRICRGYNVYDFFVIPTIRFTLAGCANYLTFEWLKWYIGICQYTEND